MNHNEVELRYGCNPHQVPAKIYVKEGRLPIKSLMENLVI